MSDNSLQAWSETIEALGKQTPAEPQLDAARHYELALEHLTEYIKKSGLGILEAMDEIEEALYSDESLV